MTKKVPTIISQFAQEAAFALLMLYFTAVVVDILKPGSISLFIDPKNILYVAVASIAVFMFVTKFSTPQHIPIASVKVNSWVGSLAISATLGWFTAWQVREYTSHEFVIGICTGLLIFLVAAVVAPDNTDETRQD